MSRWSNFKRAEPERRTFLGVTYASLAEKRCAEWLAHLGGWGLFSSWSRAKPYLLATTGKTRYTPDFQVFDASTTLIEVKGTWDTASRLRVSQFVDAYDGVGGSTLYIIPSTAFAGTRFPAWPLPEEYRAIHVLARGGWQRALDRAAGRPAIPPTVGARASRPGARASS